LLKKLLFLISSKGQAVASILVKKSEGSEVLKNRIEERLSRLISLQGSDPGFFLLATHSFVEGYLRDFLDMHGMDYHFPDLLYKLKEKKLAETKGYIKELSALNDLNNRQSLVNGVRHSFEPIDPEEAVAATYTFIQFCALIGLDHHKELQSLMKNLEIWNERQSKQELMESLFRIRLQLEQSQKENKQILDDIDELRKTQTEVSHFTIRIKNLELELEQVKESKDKKDSRVDDLRQKKHQLENEKRKSEIRITELEDAKKYLENLSRLSSYTRTRYNYEQNITRLTREQQRVLDNINLRTDFLIKGGAGTGKTLVLIKSLEKAIALQESELDFSENKLGIKLLTYNKTLAKYDKYIACVLDHSDEAEMISTADKFLYDSLRLIDRAYNISYDNNYTKNLVSEFNLTDFIDDQAVANEIEGYLFANDISRVEYIDQKILRKGLKRPLNQTQREAVWAIRDSVIKSMEESLLFTKNYSRKVILNYLADNPDDDIIRNLNFTFIDEVQDLTAVDIKTIRACSKRAVVMAGDADQSIYQPGFSFIRSDIDIRGTTKILRTNFRNTLEIHKLAERYRAKSESIDMDTQPEAFRSGPIPELYQGADKDELLSLIVKRVNLFIRNLNYDPENICILVPSNKDVGAVQEVIKAAGYNSHDLRENTFSFEAKDVIRISTLHSSKGLDFPVVLLLLHRSPFTGRIFDNDTLEKMKRNLIYVSLTRAMDHVNVNVFVLDGESKVESGDLVEVFEETNS
jgi:hypothetical protein